MRKDINSNRTKHWINRNLITVQRCKDFVIKLLENKYNIYDYEFVEDKLVIKLKQKYTISICTERVCLLLQHRNGYDCFTNDSCWFDALKKIIELEGK